MAKPATSMYSEVVGPDSREILSRSKVAHCESTLRPHKPIVSSTAGYRNEIAAPHPRHLPRNKTQLNSGTLSYHAIVFLQVGQCERGLLMLRCSGSREMQTFKKLPKSSPKRNAGSSKTSGDGIAKV